MKVIITVILLIIVLALTPTLVYLYLNKHPNIEAEQTWAYSHCKNPFEDCDTSYNYIIDVMDGYVLYVKNSNDTLSEKIEWFLVGSSNVTENIKR